jgi:hypothetical protein
VSEISTDPDDKANDKFTLNGADVSSLTNSSGSSLFRLYYQAIIGLPVYDVEPDTMPLGESVQAGEAGAAGALAGAAADVTLSYVLKNAPHETKVELVPKDDRLYYVLRDSRYTGLLAERRQLDAADGIRAALAELQAAM